MYLNLFYWAGEGPRPGQDGRMMAGQTAVRIPIQRWFHLEMFVRQSGEYDGEGTVWQDGISLLHEERVRTKFADGDQKRSVNNYAGDLPEQDVLIYVDDAAISGERLWPLLAGTQRGDGGPG